MRFRVIKLMDDAKGELHTLEESDLSIIYAYIPLLVVLLEHWPRLYSSRLPPPEHVVIWADKAGLLLNILIPLWIITGLWGLIMWGSISGSSIFRGGIAALVSRWLLVVGLPAVYAVLAKFYPGAAGVMTGGHPAAGAINTAVALIAAERMSAAAARKLRRTAGWADNRKSQERAHCTGMAHHYNHWSGRYEYGRQHTFFSLPGVIYYPPKTPEPNALDKVIGLEEAKKKVIRAMSLALDSDGQYKEYGLTPPGGILLYGPPGTGKTLFAKACAEAFGCAFYVVNASAIAAPLVGESERAVTHLFQHARNNSPAIIFWDEIDAVARIRDGANLNRPSDLILNVLLAEMDGFQSKGERGLLIIGATNRIDVLDPAILRPGRFDEKIEVGLPDRHTRAVMLEVFLKGRRTADITPGVLEEIAAATSGWSPAELKALINEAAWDAAEEGEPISPLHLDRVLRQYRR
ncbi:AAA family ATPase [Moorellaceae bacterium AZ2]